MLLTLLYSNIAGLGKCKLCWNKLKQVFNALTFSWRRSLWYRNQSINLLRKSIDWFLYHGDLLHGNLTTNAHIIETSQLIYIKIKLTDFDFYLMVVDGLIPIICTTFPPYSINTKNMKLS